MAMLALLHRIALRVAPPQLIELFPLASPRHRNTRSSATRHFPRLLERSFHSDVFKRSLYGLVFIYHLLPDVVVQATSIKIFQHKLQKALLLAAKDGVKEWQRLFSPQVS